MALAFTGFVNHDESMSKFISGAVANGRSLFQALSCASIIAASFCAFAHAQDTKPLSEKDRLQTEKVVSAMNDKIKRNPKSWQLYNDRADAYLQLGNYQPALADANSAVTLAPTSEAAYCTRGKVQLKLQRYQQAIDDLTKAIQLDPEDQVAYHFRSFGYGKLGQKNLAARDDSKSLALGYGKNPDYSAYTTNLQKRIKSHWFPPQRLLALGKTKSIASFSVDRHGQISNLKLQHSCGDKIADGAALQAVKAAAPFAHLPLGSENQIDISFTFDVNKANTAQFIGLNSTTAHGSSLPRMRIKHKGIDIETPITISLSENAERIADLDAEIRQNPKDADAYARRASAYLRLKQYKKACDDASAAINLDGSDQIAYSVRAQVNLNLKQYQPAIKDFNAAARLDPQDRKVYYYRAVAYEKSGNHKLAAQDQSIAKSLGWEAKDVRFDVDSDLGDLMFYLPDHWYPPKSPDQRHAVVGFNIHRDGHMSDLRVVHSSAVGDFDRAALDAIRAMAPFRVLRREAPSRVSLFVYFDAPAKSWTD